LCFTKAKTAVTILPLAEYILVEVIMRQLGHAKRQLVRVQEFMVKA